MNSEILLPQNMPQSAFFDFPDNKENFGIVNHLILFLSIICLKSLIQEGLKKNIIEIYKIEKQICFNDSKKETKFEKNGIY